MSNDIRFSDAQVEQLTELMGSMRDEIVEYVDERIGESERGLEKRLKKYIDDRFIAERSVIRQIVQAELREITKRIDKLEERLENDARASLEEIDRLKKRLATVEAAVAKLQPA